ncbi:MAG: hypothetical protein QXL15_04120 [Candidatus Korarchaeota archaeon]
MPPLEMISLFGATYKDYYPYDGSRFHIVSICSPTFFLPTYHAVSEFNGIRVFFTTFPAIKKAAVNTIRIGIIVLLLA